MYKRFDDFLEQQGVKSGLPTMDLQQRKDDWLKALDNLYQEIEVILRPYTANQRLAFLRFSTSISEEQLGKYTVDGVRIGLQGDGNSQVALNPVGAFVLGARGRVDMDGPTGKTVKLLLVEKDAIKPGFKTRPAMPDDPHAQSSRPEAKAEWVWKIVTPPPEIYYLDLTEANFLEALMSVMER